MKLTKNDWIDVKVQQPDCEQGNKIIAFGENYIFECEFADGYWTNLGGDDFTHWMPSPDYPVKSKDKTTF